MCGIVGAVANENVLPVLLDGLKRLEYRGYDSAGVAVINSAQQLKRTRSVGKIAELERALGDGDELCGSTGIAHTRWATHGAPTEVNAHPHLSPATRRHWYATASSKTMKPCAPNISPKESPAYRRPTPKSSSTKSRDTYDAAATCWRRCKRRSADWKARSPSA